LLVSIRDVRHSQKDRRWIQSVYSEYVESLADLNTGLFTFTGTEQSHEAEIFANWFANDQSHPLVILQAAEPVGFALVTRLRIPAAAENPVDYRLSEFFVRKQHRRAGVGRDAATLIFDRFAGEWEVVEYQRNPGAVAFWRKVVAAYCTGRFSEQARYGEVRQRFKSRPSQR
jgi:predicted acetyltransferase